MPLDAYHGASIGTVGAALEILLPGMAVRCFL